ncbi:MAG: 23S rRNA (pseudouridine(1915)-N(3))-methyltransferase RlmH [Rhodospirillales bacterium]|nr:23S rRNA (pseudouridine(1915)-N(3))-methyltransferase RlmH [Rhodospirillales bacterium]
MPATSSCICSSPRRARSTRSSACGAPSSTRSRPPLAEPLLLAVGRIGAGPEAALFARYNARLRPGFAVREIAEARGSPGEIRRREGAALLAAIPAGAFAIALDLGPPAPSSEAFAALLGRWQETGRRLCFVIGGAEGLDAPVLAAAGHVLSLGPLTWPHLLVRTLLAEQVFRARAIAAGHPSHRAARPAPR